LDDYYEYFSKILGFIEVDYIARYYAFENGHNWLFSYRMVQNFDRENFDEWACGKF